MRIALLSVACLFLCKGSSQPNGLESFGRLVGSVWEAEGKWGDGSSFKQETTFSFALDSSIVIARSKGYTNAEQSRYGMRNHGIRKVDPETGSLKFWEFDVFGGLTAGEVVCKDQNFYYHYNYGGSKVTDAWEYINDSTYNFKVGNYEKGNWKQLYLQTKFIRKGVPDWIRIYGSKLKGKWKSKAWDGVLEEVWNFGIQGILEQEAVYSVNGSVRYEAATQMQIVGEEVILFSVIKNAAPKIFKARAVSADRIVFENSEYAYPSKVVYEFLPDGSYRRTISGIQEGKNSSYTFEFSRTE